MCEELLIEGEGLGGETEGEHSRAAVIHASASQHLALSITERQQYIGGFTVNLAQRSHLGKKLMRQVIV